jgi:aspartate 1-decarboxylase|tara:strand:- start:12020 stop:12484 length:465 start_codon:yes stop_codon:yes gene_type:complete
MATVYSVQKTKWSQNNPSEKINTNEKAGRIRIAYALYEASSLASGDVIEMFNLPNGARILEGTLTHDALGSSTTLSVGHAAYVNAAGTAVALDVDEYFAAAASTSITTVAVAVTSALGRNSVVDANQDGIPVTVVMGGAAGTGTIELTMYYVVD